MLIALLAVLGVDLIVLVVVLIAVLVRRRWVSHHPGSFRGMARVLDGKINQFGARRRRGYGRWVRDVLVWTPAPLCLRNALVPVDSIEGHHTADGKLRRIGDNPQAVILVAGGARIEIIVADHDVSLVTAPLADHRADDLAPAHPSILGGHTWAQLGADDRRGRPAATPDLRPLRT
jgi:hypothetical protein